MGRHGENIRKRKDGRWEARVISSYKPDGKAIYRSVYGKTYLEAKEKRNDLLRSTAATSPRCEKTGSSKGKITLEEVAWEWLAARKDSIKESTYAHYTNLVRRHLLPCLGPRRLYALTPEVLDEFLLEKRAPAGPMAKAAFPQRPWRTFAPSFYRFCFMHSAVNIPAPHRATCFIQKTGSQLPES